MKPKQLNKFQNDAEMRDSVKLFLYESLDEVALADLYAGNSVVGIAQAKAAIDRLFAKLDAEYGQPV